MEYTQWGLHWHTAHILNFHLFDVWVVLFFHATKENKNSFWLTVIYKFILMALIYFYSCLYGNVGGGDNCVLVHIVYGTYNDYYVEGKEMYLWSVFCLLSVTFMKFICLVLWWRHMHIYVKKFSTWLFEFNTKPVMED